MPEQELFAVSVDGKKYHRRNCQYAKSAEEFIPLDQVPADAEPCDRCKPPAQNSGPQSPAPAQNSGPPPVDEVPSAKSGKSVCVRGCAIRGVWVPKGVIVDTKDVRGSSHFREI